MVAAIYFHGFLTRPAKESKQITHYQGSPVCPPSPSRQIPRVFFHLQEISSKVTKLSLQTIEKLNLSTSIFLTKFPQCRLGLTGTSARSPRCSGRFGWAGRHQRVLEGTCVQLRAPWESHLTPRCCKGCFPSVRRAGRPFPLLLSSPTAASRSGASSSLIYRKHCCNHCKQV